MVYESCWSMWQSRRQTRTALSPPEAEVVGLSEALMPSVVTHDACKDIGLAFGVSPDVLCCQDG